MRKPILVVWLLLPLAAWTYHEGPGQEWLRLDEVDAQLQRAEAAVSDEDWAVAIESYEAALKPLPPEKVTASRRIRLALNHARMMHKQLPRARAALAKLVDEMAADADADQALLDDVRKAQASSQYYMTWLMRLEGYAREEWEPEIEAARQNYRLLAERAELRGKASLAKQCREDLESAVKLARMDLQELQGIPLPNQ